MSHRSLTLNVGGVLYETTATTLRNSPFFAALLEHTSEEAAVQCSTTRDAHGNLFVDRNGGLFAKVLEHLRNAPVDLGNIRDPELVNELLFYGVGQPKKWIKQYVSLQSCAQEKASSRGGEEKFRKFTAIVTGPKEVLLELEIGDQRKKIKKISKYSYRAFVNYQYELEMTSCLTGMRHDLLTMGFVVGSASQGQGGAQTFERDVLEEEKAETTTDRDVFEDPDNA